MFFVILGSSDPYVKIRLANKDVFRSKTIHKNLNPVWDEKTTVIMDSLSEPLNIKVKAWTHTHSKKKLFHLLLLMSIRVSGDAFVAPL